MKIYIHAGTNKTGTSAIQAFMLRHPEFLAEHGFLYPESGRWSKPAHHEMALFLKNGDKKNLSKFYGELVEESESKNLQNIIISSELLFNYSPELLKEIFKDHAVVPILYVRNHVDYLNSWYRQGVKGKKVSSSFDRYVVKADAHLHPKLAKWKEHFGSQMIVRKYSKDSLLNGSSLDQFIFDVMGLYPEQTEGLFKQIENISIGGNLLYLKRRLNNYVDYDTATSESLQYELWELSKADPTFGMPVYVEEKTLERLKEKYSADAKSILSDFKVDISDQDTSVESCKSPNFETFDEDKEKILQISLKNRFEIGKLIQRHLGENVINKEYE